MTTHRETEARAPAPVHDHRKDPALQLLQAELEALAAILPAAAGLPMPRGRSEDETETLFDNMPV